MRELDEHGRHDKDEVLPPLLSFLVALNFMSSVLCRLVELCDIFIFFFCASVEHCCLFLKEERIKNCQCETHPAWAWAWQRTGSIPNGLDTNVLFWVGRIQPWLWQTIPCPESLFHSEQFYDPMILWIPSLISGIGSSSWLLCLLVHI